jgi:predicted RNA-binding Zn-ribbon protein involved in translation (DUF1610 family)
VETLLSAGDCPVCETFGAVLFVKAVGTKNIFFLCPMCGVAWVRPPAPHILDEISSPQLHAPQGIDLPTRAEIDAAGLTEDIRREIPFDNAWAHVLREYMSREKR